MTLACSVNDLFAWRFQRDASGARVKDASLFPEESVEKTRLLLTIYHDDGLFWCSVFNTSTPSAGVKDASLIPEEGVKMRLLPLTVFPLYIQVHSI
jgi:hypothetical protein